MIPVGGLIGGLVAARHLGSGGRARQYTPEEQNFIARIFVAVPLFTFAGFGVEFNRWLGWPLVAFVALGLVLPTVTLERAIVPLGLPRVAYWYARLTAPIPTTLEKRGASIVFGALAALQARRVDDRTLAWLEQVLDDERELAELHGRGARSCVVLASGLLAVLRGRDESARLLLSGLEALPRKATPPIVRKTTLTWLVADAARRGDWRAVTSRSEGTFSSPPWPRLMGAIAKRLLGGEDAPSDVRLWLAWLGAPHRRATLPLLRRALRVQRGSDVPKDEPDASGPEHAGDALEAALGAHATFVRSPSPRGLVAAARAWDAARVATGSSALLARRALALETSSDSALLRVFETAESDLAPHVDLAPPGAPKSSTLEAAAASARRRDLDAIETTVKALRRRTVGEEAIDGLDEWMEWATLSAMCERARGDGTNLERRRTVFSVVYATACNHAVWLFNARGEKLLANSMFQWLLEEGEPVAEERVKTLLRKNVASGYG